VISLICENNAYATYFMNLQEKRPIFLNFERKINSNADKNFRKCVPKLYDFFQRLSNFAQLKFHNLHKLLYS